MTEVPEVMGVNELIGECVSVQSAGTRYISTDNTVQ